MPGVPRRSWIPRSPCVPRADQRNYSSKLGGPQEGVCGRPEVVVVSAVSAGSDSSERETSLPTIKLDKMKVGGTGRWSRQATDLRRIVQVDRHTPSECGSDVHQRIERKTRDTAAQQVIHARLRHSAPPRLRPGSSYCPERSPRSCPSIQNAGGGLLLLQGCRHGVPNALKFLKLLVFHLGSLINE